MTATTTAPADGRAAPRDGSSHLAGHLPGLDGLRALAVLLVVASHAWSPRAGAATSGFAKNLGGHGVTVFLVLSGFLITTLLLRERERTGRIDLLRFAARRAVRLWPTLWLVVAVTVALAAAGVVPLRRIDLVSSLLFFQNYVVGAPVGPLRHTWSLALEEQFYLVWPLALVALGAARARWVLAAAIAVAPVWRVVLVAVDPDQFQLVNFTFHTRYDSLAVGCLLALVWGAPRFHRALAALDRWGGATAAAAVLVATVVVGSALGRPFMHAVGMTVENVAVAVLLAHVVAGPRRRCTRLLSWRPLAGIGVVSYALYLWQQVFVVRAPEPFEDPVVGCAAALAAAVATYWLLERPLQRLRRRLQGPRPV